MISHDHKFIFIHVYKVAGTSVRNVLRPYSEGLSPAQRRVNKWSRKITGHRLFKRYEQPLDGHATAAEFKAYLGPEVYDSFFTFAFVRNPFDWLVSLYEFIRQNPRHRQHEICLKMSFAEFIAWRCGEELYLQKNFVQEDGKTIVDFIGRFENLDADFATALARAGVAGQMRHLNPSKRKPFQEYYTAKTRRQVVAAHAEDFELFGYAKTF